MDPRLLPLCDERLGKLVAPHELAIEEPALSPVPSQQPSVCVPIPLVDDKCEEWVSTFDGPAHETDVPGEGLINSRVLGTSPDGKVVYVAGESDSLPGEGSDFDFVPIALDAATGHRLWTGLYAGPTDQPQAVSYSLAVSPKGSAIFVTGTTYSMDGASSGVATTAFDAATGELLWASQFPEESFASAAAVSPSGDRVYVAGETLGQNPDGTFRNQAMTLAYDAATGAQLWVAPYQGGPGDRTGAWRIAASPDGSRVYVAGNKLDSQGVTVDVLLLVYDPRSGALVRETHHLTRGVPPAGIAVSEDGSRVFVEEANLETGLNNNLTLAYDAAGNKLWTARFQGCEELKCSSRPWYYAPITASPDGARVFVTSLGVIDLLITGFYTVAYDAATGEELWATRYESNIGDCFCGPTVEANANSQEVYITSLGHITATVDATTIAYDAATGRQKWVGIYRDGASDTSSSAVAVGPAGDRVFVSGSRRDLQGEVDILGLAYNSGPAMEADLIVTKTESSDPVTVGRNLTYSVAVANRGPDGASGTTLTDNLPTSATFVSAAPSQGTCGESGGAITCALGVIGAGGGATVDIVVKPTSAGTITNTASVRASTPDPNPGDNLDSEDTRVCRRTSRRMSVPCE